MLCPLCVQAIEHGVSSSLYPLVPCVQAIEHGVSLIPVVSFGDWEQVGQKNRATLNAVSGVGGRRGFVNSPTRTTVPHGGVAHRTCRRADEIELAATHGTSHPLSCYLGTLHLGTLHLGTLVSLVPWYPW